jgi:hypothetical protein
MKRLIATACALALVVVLACGQGSGLSGTDPKSFPLSKTVPAKAPPFKIDPAKDFHIELGRGSGMDGFETVAVERNGQVVLHRLKDEIKGRWQKATATLDRAAIDRVLAAVESNKIMEMAAAYHNDEVQDGTQWILWIRQGESSKAIYFNNHFPEAIKSFAKALDAEIQRAAIPEVRWEDDAKPRSHEKALWESTK